MVDLGSYKDKFGDSGQRILEHALNESRRRDQNFVSVEHILQALTVEEPDMFNSAMRDLSLDPVVVKMAIEKRLGSSRQQSWQLFWLKKYPSRTPWSPGALEGKF